ncbi:MAG: hypothetical protein V5A47_13425 [Bacteroidales bacterium]
MARDSRQSNCQNPDSGSSAVSGTEFIRNKTMAHIQQNDNRINNRMTIDYLRQL